MADRYWVGGGSSTNWNATGNTNWSATSGGANNASVPGTGDNVFFDANSGTGNSVISASQSIGTLDCTGYAGTLTSNSGTTLTVDAASGVIKFGSGMTTALHQNAFITITGATGTITITSNGKTISSLTINAPGGLVQLADALRVEANSVATLTLTAGHFDANDQDVYANNVAGSGSTTRTLSMGSGTWRLTRASGSAFLWSFTTVTNLTFNKETANIIITGPGSSALNGQFIGGGLTYNDLTFEAPAAGVARTTLISGANTFAHLNIGAGWTVALSANQTIQNAPTWIGTPAQPIIFYGSDQYTARTISVASGTVSLTWGVLQNITGAGGATFTSANTMNAGGVTGWTVNKPGTRAWAGIA